MTFYIKTGQGWMPIAQTSPDQNMRNEHTGSRMHVAAPHDPTLCESLSIDINFDGAQNFVNVSQTYRRGLAGQDWSKHRENWKRKTGTIYLAPSTPTPVFKQTFASRHKHIQED